MLWSKLWTGPDSMLAQSQDTDLLTFGYRKIFVIY